jgi:hypothetical protein
VAHRLGNEVVVTYEQRRPDGSGGYNTELLTFDEDERIARPSSTSVWDLVSADPCPVGGSRCPQADPSLGPAPSTGRRDLGIFGPTEERCRGAALIG